ncbi:unnamed protein product [Microthlaspi erraticum]|uniref:DUF1985 domain-containing protein n=1 Tax=Microthlaspi erraticum TaxID=1685480 RepID=A0A6D2KMT5_9BRAS|nr:unnamed protein product [Microthlaspi erraticum]
MAPTSNESNYPQLLYPKGKAPSQKKSMSFYSYLSNFQMVKVGVGIDAWEALKESAVGVFLMFYEQDHIFSAKLVHYILTHQLVVKKYYEIWSLIDWQPIRLSLIEFGEITGLNIGPFDVGDTFDIDHREFWEELHVSPVVGPNLVELREVLDRCKSWCFEKRRSVGWLCILHIAVYGIAPTARIPLEAAKRVLNADAFERYPWGRVACKSLIHSIKCLNYHAKESYTVEGFVYVLQIWAYEAITGVGELYGNRIDGARVPMLSWGGSRPRFEPSEFLRHEKEAHDNKVRVRHFLSLMDGNVVPNWDKEENDEKVTILVRDILDDHIIPTAWDVLESQVCMRKKRKASVPIINSHYSTNPKVKDQQVNGDDERGGASNAAGNVTQDNDVFGMLHKLTDKVDSMGADISNNLLAGLDAAIETKLDAAIETKA